MAVTESYTVGQVAGFTGVTVRALHHYDAIGLLRPSERSETGYRRYSASDLERLGQVLYYRELGFGLEDIAGILDDPDVDSAAHLRRQHRLLKQRIAHLEGMVAAIERTMEAKKMGISLTPEEQFEVFGENWRGGDYDKEAEERWGGTAAYQESMRRAAALTKADWIRLKAAGDDLDRRFAAALRGSKSSDSVEAMDLAEEHRAGIGRFFECDHAMHKHMADMYVTDSRFRDRYEAIAPGLAEYVRSAVHANAERAKKR